MSQSGFDVIWKSDVDEFVFNLEKDSKGRNLPAIFECR